jgi:FlaA1/EpsC-like NDP-sugar epimerase
VYSESMDLELSSLFPERKVNSLMGSQDLQGYRYRRTLVTGGAGSIGSSVVRKLIEKTETDVCILDNDESRMHSLFQSFSSKLQKRITFFVTDIRDRDGLLQRLSTFKPDMIVHAAALKHVSILERQPRDAYLTNVLGTENLIDFLETNTSTSFVFVSSDKAALPTSVLGKTKLIGEYLTGRRIERDKSLGIERSLSIVRFGNVFLSRGSVLETFISQVEKNQPITITDGRMTRFFMDIAQASDLILYVMQSQIPGISIFKMGDPINIEELAKRLMKVLNASNEEILYIGMKPGEKIHEDLFSNIEEHSRVDLGLIFNVSKVRSIPMGKTLGYPTTDAESLAEISKLLDLEY